ncbi:MAG: hypothetical protein ACK4RX_06245 [Chitinophagaceae bacterium]
MKYQQFRERLRRILKLIKGDSEFPLHPFVTTMNKLYGHEQTVVKHIPIDKDANPLPWFTYPAIDYLEQLDLSNCAVFEWGAGYSSLFFLKRVSKVTSIESSAEWYAKMKEGISPNHTLLYHPEHSNEYWQSIQSFHELFDIIVIDGVNRDKCIELAPHHLKEGGMIIFDNADRDPQLCQKLREQGFNQIDMHGFGPINYYTWTTSFFFKMLAFKPKGNQPVIPKGGGY